MTLHLSYDRTQKDVSYSPQFLQNQMTLIEKKNTEGSVAPNMIPSVWKSAVERA